MDYTLSAGAQPADLQPRSLVPSFPGSLRVALVHDWLITLGGADRVLLALHEIFPQAPVFVGLYDLSRLPEPFRRLDVRGTWLQRVPGAAHHHRLLVPLMPLAFGRVDLRGYDVVVSSSHACAQGVSVPSNARHVCYCHTPMRYAWDLQNEYLAALPAVARPPARVALARLRRWDRAAAQRVDYFIANSHHVAGRIRRHYGREAAVIYPPVDTDFFTPAGDPQEFYLAVSRLVPYKRLDVVVAAFNLLERPLVVVGDGPERRRLQAMAHPHVQFAGEVSETALRGYYRRCRALVFAGEEDFGIVPVEAQACGRPVIAYGRGGVLESVLPGITGFFFQEQTVDAVVAAVRASDAVEFDRASIRHHAEQFSAHRFEDEVTAFLASVIADRDAPARHGS